MNTGVGVSTGGGVGGSGTAGISQPIPPAVLRRIHRAGWALFAVWALVLVAWGILRPDPYAQGWRLVLELAFVGRLVSVADGIASGFHQGYLLFQNGLQDIILLLVAYPWVVAAYQGAVRRGVIGRGIDRVRRTAEGHKRIVEPLGVIGLWAFVFFPFWSTGALVGGVVGYLLGMRTWLVFASVFAGHALSVVSLVWFFDAMHDFAESIDTGIVRYLPWIVLGALVLLALATKGVKALVRRRGLNREGARRRG
jgi:uncharacterized membrane protein